MFRCFLVRLVAVVAGDEVVAVAVDDQATLASDHGVVVGGDVTVWADPLLGFCKIMRGQLQPESANVPQPTRQI